MAGKTYSKIVQVDSDNDATISFDVEVTYYYDGGRTWGLPEDCYPEEFEKIDEGVLRIFVLNYEVEDPELWQHIFKNFEEDWIYEQAWENI